MKPQLIQSLVCPATGERLTLTTARASGAEILAGELTSESGRRYPITGGVPRMIPAESADDGQDQTAGPFSAKWRRAADFGHEERSRTFYLNWYLQRYKFATIAALREFLTGKRRILDAGTGLGRDSRLYADNSTATVFGVDISSGIDEAYRHLRSHPNVHLLQADLTQLPFPPAFFDFIACDQVLHHTHDTEQSFHRLATHLAPGGDLSIYVYRRKAPLRELADDHLRQAAIAMSEEEAWELAEQLTSLGRALSELRATISVPDIPALGIAGGTHDIQRFIYWHFLKCYWNPALRHDDNVITNFDWYRPRYAHRHTADEVRRWFAAAGLEIVTFDESTSGISVRGRRAE
jgi:SAM-dependent methyltransferase